MDTFAPYRTVWMGGFRKWPFMLTVGGSKKDQKCAVVIYGCTQGLIETLGLIVIFDENQVVSDLNKYELLYPAYVKIIKFLVI